MSSSDVSAQRRFTFVAAARSAGAATGLAVGSAWCGTDGCVVEGVGVGVGVGVGTGCSIGGGTTLGGFGGGSATGGSAGATVIVSVVGGGGGGGAGEAVDVSVVVVGAGVVSVVVVGGSSVGGGDDIDGIGTSPRHPAASEDTRPGPLAISAAGLEPSRGSR